MLSVSTLLPFFKIGAIGAGFAFLVLTFRLLAQELRRRQLRHGAIMAVFAFAAISLIFFVTGVFAERLIPDPFINYVTLDMGHYGFDTTTNTIKFQMAAIHPDASRYVTRSESSDYEIVVGIREEGPLPADAGRLEFLERGDPLDKEIENGVVVHRDRNVVCILRPPKPKP
jgi:hypothetical protein